MRSLIIATCLATLAITVHSTEIVDLPQESNIIPLKPKSSLLQSTLDRAIEDAQKGIPASWGQITFATINEGKTYFSDYLIEKLGPEEAERIAPIFLSDVYFALDLPAYSQLLTASEIFWEDPYVSTHISNMLDYGSPGREGTMEAAKKRWNPKTHFLTPKEVFMAVARHDIYGRSIEIKDFNEYKAAYPEKVETIFSSRYFGIPEEEHEKIDYFLNNSLGFFTHELVNAVYQGAKKIMDFSNQGDNIVIFGNTPYFVGRALSFLISNDVSAPNHRTLIELPFSGAPNRVRERSFPTTKNIVTAERLAHLKKRLSKLGLSSDNLELQNQQTHFVDVIGSGSGIAYVIEELLRDFKTAGISVPYFDIFCMNKINIHNEDDKRNASIAEQNAEDGEQIMISLPSLQDTHFRIPMRITYVEGHGHLDMLPSEEWRVFPEYNPVYWQDEYDHLLEKEHPHHIKVLFDYFDTNIKDLMSKE